MRPIVLVGAIILHDPIFSRAAASQRGVTVSTAQAQCIFRTFF